MSQKPSDLLPGIIEEWREDAALVLVDDGGLSRNEAADLAKKIVLRITNNVAGSNLYIPVCYAHKLTERDREIWAAYRNGNYHELARRFGLTARQIRRIVRRARALDALTRNLPLFPADGSSSDPR